MSFKNDLLKWQEAVEAFEKKDYAGSINAFLEITGIGAKIYFNMGMIYAEIGRHEDAIISFTNATYQDQYLVVGYFQRGVIEWILGDYESAIDSFTEAHNNLRSNKAIDYRQLGLNYILFGFETLFNRALCYFAMGDTESAMKDLEKAQKVKGMKEHEDARYLPANVRSCWDKGDLDNEYLPFAVPEGLLYRPSKLKVRNTDSVDFLGSSKVIASVDADDDFVGFVGPKVRDALMESKKKLALRLEEVSSVKNGGQSKTTTASPELSTKPLPPITSHSLNTSPLMRKLAAIDTNLSVAPPSPSLLSPKVASNHPNLNRVAVPQSPAKSPFQPSKRMEPVFSKPQTPISNSPPQLPKSQTSGTISPPHLTNEERSVGTPGSFMLTPPSTSGQGKLRIKCYFKNQIRLMALGQDELSFATLVEKLRQKFDLTEPRVNFTDEDGEQVCMSDQEDLETALMFLDSNKLEIHVE